MCTNDNIDVIVISDDEEDTRSECDNDIHGSVCSGDAPELFKSAEEHDDFMYKQYLRDLELAQKLSLEEYYASSASVKVEDRPGTSTMTYSGSRKHQIDKGDNLPDRKRPKLFPVPSLSPDDICKEKEEEEFSDGSLPDLEYEGPPEKQYGDDISAPRKQYEESSSKTIKLKNCKNECSKENYFKKSKDARNKGRKNSGKDSDCELVGITFCQRRYMKHTSKEKESTDHKASGASLEQRDPNLYTFDLSEKLFGNGNEFTPRKPRSRHNSSDHSGKKPGSPHTEHSGKKPRSRHNSSDYSCKRPTSPHHSSEHSKKRHKSHHHHHSEHHKSKHENRPSFAKQLSDSLTELRTTDSSAHSRRHHSHHSHSRHSHSRSSHSSHSHHSSHHHSSSKSKATNSKVEQEKLSNPDNIKIEVVTVKPKIVQRSSSVPESLDHDSEREQNSDEEPKTQESRRDFGNLFSKFRCESYVKLVPLSEDVIESYSKGHVSSRVRELQRQDSVKSSTGSESYSTAADTLTSASYDSASDMSVVEFDSTSRSQSCSSSKAEDNKVLNAEIDGEEAFDQVVANKDDCTVAEGPVYADLDTGDIYSDVSDTEETVTCSTSVSKSEGSREESESKVDMYKVDEKVHPKGHVADCETNVERIDSDRPEIQGEEIEAESHVDRSKVHVKTYDAESVTSSVNRLKLDESPKMGLFETFMLNDNTPSPRQLLESDHLHQSKSESCITSSSVKSSSSSSSPSRLVSSSTLSSSISPMRNPLLKACFQQFAEKVKKSGKMKHLLVMKSSSECNLNTSVESNPSSPASATSSRTERHFMDAIIEIADSPMADVDTAIPTEEIEVVSVTSSDDENGESSECETVNKHAIRFQGSPFSDSSEEEEEEEEEYEPKIKLVPIDLPPVPELIELPQQDIKRPVGSQASTPSRRKVKVRSQSPCFSPSSINTPSTSCDISSYFKKVPASDSSKTVKKSGNKARFCSQSIEFPETDCDLLANAMSQMHLNTIHGCFEEGNLFLDHGLQFLNDFATSHKPSPEIIFEVIKNVFAFKKDDDKILVLKAYRTLSFIHQRYGALIKLDWAVVLDCLNATMPCNSVKGEVIPIEAYLLLDLIVQILCDELFAKDISEQREIRSSTAYKLMSYDVASSNIGVIVGFIRSSIMHGQFEELRECKIATNGDRTPKSLPILQRLLELSTLVSSSAEDCANFVASELLHTTYKYLPNVQHKQLLLQTICSDLVQFKLAQLIMENQYDNTLPVSGFSDSLSVITDCFFGAVPTRSSLTPPTTPQSDDEYMRDHPTYDVLVAPSCCEELAMVLFFVVRSYISCSKSKSYCALRRRCLLEKQQMMTMRPEDKSAVHLLQESSERLREHMLKMCPELTPATEHFLLMMNCLSQCG